MKILVCMKQIIEGAGNPLGDDFVLNREKAQSGINPADCIALEQALRIQEACENGAEITVLTMGPEKAENLLRWVASYPVSQLVLVSDPLYRGSDTLATARVLSTAAAYLGGFDLVLMGRRAIDGETGHVGPEVSAFMGIPCITNVTSITNITSITSGTPLTNVTSVDTSTKENVTCLRLLEQKRQSLQVSLPAVITLCGGGQGHELRPASILGMKRAKTMPVLKISNEELALPIDQVGLIGSPTWVVALKDVAPMKKATRFYDDPQEGAAAILELIKNSDVSDKEESITLINSKESSRALQSNGKMNYAETKFNKSIYNEENFSDNQMDFKNNKNTESYHINKREIKSHLNLNDEIGINAVNTNENPHGLHGIFVYEAEESVKASLQLIYHAYSSGCNTLALVTGKEDVTLANKLMMAGAKKIIFLGIKPTEDDYFIGCCLAEALNQIALESLVFPATVRGRTIAPICAAKKTLGITADCTEVRYLSHGTILQIRPTFGETKLAEIKCKTKPQLATVRPNIYPDPPVIAGTDYYDANPTDNNINALSICYKTSEWVQLIEEETLKQTGLLEATGILVGGKALNQNDFRLLEKLAWKLNFQVGASRSAVDGGAAPYEMQIGQTGKTVRPKFYIAFGISGAVQHLAGMKDSTFIIAINKDKKAPIFDYADIGIYGDWKETAEELMKLIEV